MAGAGAGARRVEAARAGDQFPAVYATGARIVGELHCSGCAYGIVAAWQESPWRPFARAQGRS